MLMDTRLSTSIRTRDLYQLAVLGKTVQFEAGQLILREGERSGHLYVILEGEVFLEASNALPRIWLGAGDVFGEIGFLLGARRTRTVRAGLNGCTLWQVSRRALLSAKSPLQYWLRTLLLIALEPILSIRARKLWVKANNVCSIGHHYCDHTHPAIRKMGAFLQRKDDWDTALAIWQFVRNMPYRFGSWHLRASQTLRLGYGMCTTKANLQAALLRACGLKAGFTELVVPSKFVASLLPGGYQPRIGSTIKHYFAIVYLDGKWFPCDASFTRESLILMAEANPEVIPCIDEVFERGKPFNPVGEKNGWDAFDFTPLHDIDHIFQKCPFYDDDNFEAMNIKLDRIQNPVYPIPGWVRQAREQLKNNAEFAFQIAYSGIFADAFRLYRLLGRQGRKNSELNRTRNEKTTL